MKVKLQRTVEVEDIPARAADIVSEAIAKSCELVEKLRQLQNMLLTDHSLLNVKSVLTNLTHECRSQLSTVDLCVQDCNDVVQGYCILLEQLVLQGELDQQEDNDNELTTP